MQLQKKKTAAAAALSFPSGQRTATARPAILAKPVPSPWRVPREEGFSPAQAGSSGPSLCGGNVRNDHSGWPRWRRREIKRHKLCWLERHEYWKLRGDLEFCFKKWQTLLKVVRRLWLTVQWFFNELYFFFNSNSLLIILL